MNLINIYQKFAVFGSRGMVGGAVCRVLKKNGYLNILTPTKKELNLQELSSVEDWFKFNKPEVVILSAAKVGGILANNNYPADFILENLKIQTNVIEASWKNGVKKFLFLGSSCIYPKYATQPLREEELLSGHLEATNQWYAIAKIAGIKLCEALNKQYGFNSICLMPTNLYGIGDNYDKNNSHVLASFIRRFCEAQLENKKEVICWGSGLPRREFLNVDDLAGACLFVLENWDYCSYSSPKDINGELLPFLNVGTGKDISIKELAILISELVGFRGNIIWDNSKPDGTPKKLLNTSRINKMGWKPKINFKDGIINTIKVYKRDFLK